jgi:hypothetical protein
MTAQHAFLLLEINKVSEPEAIDDLIYLKDSCKKLSDFFEETPSSDLIMKYSENDKCASIETACASIETACASSHPNASLSGDVCTLSLGKSIGIVYGN